MRHTAKKAVKMFPNTTNKKYSNFEEHIRISNLWYANLKYNFPVYLKQAFPELLNRTT
jgi:hypothetical protein